MTLWRIKDGTPSIADALLVAGGMICGIGIFIPLFDRILDYFDPRGLLVLGYAVLLVIGMSSQKGSGFTFHPTRSRTQDPASIAPSPHPHKVWPVGSAGS
jgi:hypothetical protein